jgi:antitoxin Phd
MLNTWQLQEAKAKFSAVVDAAWKEGPQFITRHGQPSVVVVSQDEYDRLKPKNSLVDFFRESPLFGEELDLTRSRDTGREMEW